MKRMDDFTKKLLSGQIKLNINEEQLNEIADKTDFVKMDIPLFIRLLEYAREDAKDDMDLHKVTERMLAIHHSGVELLGMDNYDNIVKESENKKEK